MKDKIVDMAFNDSWVRDTARVLKIGINTVLRTLKTQPKAVLALVCLRYQTKAGGGVHVWSPYQYHLSPVTGITLALSDRAHH